MIDFVKKYWKNILIGIFFFIIIVLVMSTTCTNKKLDIANTNLMALTDTLHIYQLKNGELMYEKQGFILKKNELEKYIDIKEKEIKDIEKQLKSALATIAKMQAEINIDTIHTIDSIKIVSDSIFDSYFDYNDKWLILNGVTNIQLNSFKTHTIINNINMEVPLKIGTTKDDKWFVTSENPYVYFSSIEGANLDKAKPKHWAISVQGGVGGIFGYGISGAKDGLVRSGWIVGAGGYIGFGISYKIWEF